VPSGYSHSGFAKIDLGFDRMNAVIPTRSVAKFYEYMTNSRKFNNAIRSVLNGFHSENQIGMVR
jgi:hypothetical protein